MFLVLCLLVRNGRVTDFRSDFADVLSVVIYLEIVKDSSKAFSDGFWLVVAHV